MKALKIIGIVVVVLALMVVSAIFMLPDTIHMERSIEISASPKTIYRELITYKNFNSWSPWYEKDTTTQYSYEGPLYGVGTKVSWNSTSSEVGSGSMEIIDSEENSYVKSLMKFGGFDSEPTATMQIQGDNDLTQVTWTYDESNVQGIGRIFGAMMDMFLGPDYERGLQKLKDRIESMPEETTDIMVTTVSPIPYIGIEDSSENDQSLLSTKMAKDYGQLTTFLSKNGMEAGGSPFAIFTSYTAQDIRFVCAIPYKGILETTPDGLIKSTNYKGLALKATYFGDYSGLEAVHKELNTYADFAGYEITGYPWEEYVTDPTAEADPTSWKTLVFYPIK